MEQKFNEIEVNGVTYVPKTSVEQMATKLSGMDYCIVMNAGFRYLLTR